MENYGWKLRTELHNDIDRVLNTAADWRPTPGIPVPTRQEKNVWDKFLQAFVMTTVDKSPQDAAFVCQRLYAERLALALRSNEYVLYEDQNGVAVAPQDAEDGIVPDLYRELSDIAHCIPIVPDQAVGDLLGARKRAAKAAARKRKQGHPRARAPHAKLTVKAHKDPVAFRVVISTSSSAIHAISSTLSTLLNVCIGELADVQTGEVYDNIDSAGARTRTFWNGQRCLLDDAVQPWIIESSAELKDLRLRHTASTAFRRQDRAQTPPRVRTLDFSNMYTHIPHDGGEHGLLQRLEPLLGKVFRAHMPGQAGRQRPGRTRVPMIEITRDQENYNKPIGRWRVGSQRTRNDKDLYTQTDIMEMLRFCLDRLYIQFAGTTFRQRHGLPMGLSPSGQLANLYLHTYESEFMRRHIVAATDDAASLEILRHFRFSRRYIDDIISLGNDCFGQFKYLPGLGAPPVPPVLRIPINDGIYPAGILVLNDEGDNLGGRRHVSYMDTVWTYDTGERRLRVGVHHKCNDPKYAAVPFTRFQHMEDTVAIGSQYNVIRAEITRYASLCSNRADFARHAASLLYNLVYRRHYDRDHVLRVLRRHGHTRPAAALYGSQLKTVEIIEQRLRHLESTGASREFDLH